MVQCSADNLPAKTGLRWTNKHLMLLVYWQTAVELPQTDHLLFQSFFFSSSVSSSLFSLLTAWLQPAACYLHKHHSLQDFFHLLPFNLSFVLQGFFLQPFFFSFYFSTEVMFLRFLCCLCASCFLCTR